MKFRVATAPETQSIYFLLYDDPYHTSLSEVWRVIVHSLHRIDVNCVLGQTNSASLVLRGSSFSRVVECHTDHANELMVMSPSPFSLLAGTLNEINLLVRPTAMETTEMLLNIVGIEEAYNNTHIIADKNQKCLVSSWNVVLHSSAPTVTKAFEIAIPRGKTVNKRVSYKNPYSHKKVLYLKTDQPHLLQFKEEVLEMEAGATQYIGMKFAPCTSASAMSFLVFLNDEADKIEECLNVKVEYRA